MGRNPGWWKDVCGIWGSVLFERLIEIRDEEPHGAALNMAVDEMLLEVSREPLLRIYRWASPAVSFGYFGKYAPVADAWPGREIVRRMTGGGIVPHSSDLTYSLIVPSGHPFSERSPRDVYRIVHERIAGALASAGEVLALAPASKMEGTGVCFESPAEFDLLAREKKVAGAALRRTRDGLLLQGSVQDLPGLEYLRAQLASAFSAQTVEKKLSQEEFAKASALALLKYGTPEWNARV
jgi:lipoyl(octanoyl) transferase